MREAARTRRAAVEAIEDIDPPALQELIVGLLQEGTMAPGALTIACADAPAESGSNSLTSRAVGVQLIYDGLRLTRDLATTEPWEQSTDASDADLRILAADILVARGFEILASTPAATKAVETVRSFGRSQRHPNSPEVTAVAQLEQDIAELAVIAGTTLDDEPHNERLRERAATAATGFGVPLPPAERFLGELSFEQSSQPNPISAVERPAPTPDDD